MGFKKLEAWDMPGNPFEMIEHQAALFTARYSGWDAHKR